MADSPSIKPAAPANKRPTLLPQAEHAGKPAMPLGAHLFTLIGSRNRAHLHLLSSTISRNHACIVTGRGGVYVRDLASRNGVIVNGRKVRESELHDGDLMQVGSFKFKFQEPPGPIRLATAPRPPLAMLEMDGRALTPMDERTVLIGRRPGCDIMLDSPAVSNTHAVIFECDGKRYVRDLGSRTGTQVNGNTVHQQAIEIGDQIKIGSTMLRYIAADMPSVAADESLPLELETAAADEEDHAPVDLHFDEPAAREVEEPAPAIQSEFEPIPLVEPAAEHAEPVSTGSVESADEIEFPTEHAEGIRAEFPAGDQIPLPVEEELPPIQQDVTAALTASAEPAEDQSQSADVWTPPSEQTVTVDAAAVEPIPFEESHADNAVISAAETTEAAPLENITGETEVENLVDDNPIAAEPEASSLETTASATEPDLAEPPIPTEPVEALHGPVAAPLDESQQAIEEQPAPAALNEIAPDLIAESESSAEPVAEPEPESTVVSIEESPATIDATEPALQVPAEIEVTIAEPSGSQDVTPSNVDEIDLSNVTFGANIAEAEPAIDVTPEAPAAPVPLLDLILPTSEQPAEPEASAPAADAIEPPASTVKKRATRSPRKKQGTSRSRRKRSEVVAEESPAAGEQELTAPIAEAASSEDTAADATPTASEPGFVASEAIDEEVPSQPIPSGWEPAAVGVESTPSEQQAEPVAEPSTHAVEEPAVAESAAIEAMHPTDEAIAEPAPAEMSEEALSDFEPPAVREIPPEPESASIATELPVSVSTEAETGEPIATDFGLTADSASVSPVEPIPTSEGPLSETPMERVPDASIPSVDATATSAEVPSPAEEESAQGQIDTTAQPLADSEFPLRDAELPLLPPLPDEHSSLAETSELTSHIDFVHAEQNTVVSVTEPPTETIDGTEPTPESALDLEPSLPPLDGEPVEIETPTHPDALLSDTAFGQVVTDFASQETGPLVEEVPVTPPPASPTESPENESQLMPLGDADLPPLELGEALTFGSEEIETLATELPVEVAPEPQALKQPAVTDSILSPAALEPTAPVAFEPLESDLEPIEPSLNSIEPELNLEPAPEVASELAEPVEEPRFDTGLEWEEPVGGMPEVDESGLEFEPLTISGPESIEPAAPENISTSAASEPIAPEVSFVSTESDITPAAPPAQGSSEPRAEATPPPTSQRSGPPMNPFFGMERDLGSFIGGMPLALGARPASEAQPPAELAQRASAAPAPAAPVATPPPESHRASAAPSPAGVESDEPLKLNEQAKDEFDLDKLFEGEEPLELFDETADQLDKLPDSLEPIGDLGSAIGETLSPASAAAPAIAPEVSVVPAVPLRSLTADAASVPPKPPTTSVTVPPFAGAARSGKGANPFAGALGGMRPTDVFSQTAFPPMAEPTFKAQPLDIPPMTAGKSGGARLAPLPGSDSGAPQLKTDGNAIAALPPSQRPMVPRPTPAMLAGKTGQKRTWWKNLRFLVPLLVLLILAAVVVIIRFFPPKTVVHGTLQIKGIDDRALDVYARREQINRVRTALASREVRDAVKQRLQNQGIAPGFIASDTAMLSLAEPENSPFEDGRLDFQRPQQDAQDEARMRALLKAVYLMNQTSAEQTAQVRAQAAAAAERAKAMATQRDAQHDRLNRLADQVKATGGAAATALLADPDAAVTTLQSQDAALRKALDQANDNVAHRHDEWQQAQDSAHQNDGAAEHRILQFRENLARLNAELMVARISSSGQTNPAKTFDGALSDVDGILTSLSMAASKDAALANYTSTAREALARIRSLLDAANQDGARIDDLRQQLGAHREAHLRQLFADDETLKGLIEERDAQAHRFGTASDSGYSQDAARIQGGIGELDQKIEARRQSLASIGQPSDELQQHIEQTIEQLKEDQTDKQSKITAALPRLDIPAVGKLPLKDERLLDEIGTDVARLKDAHDQYASGAKADGIASAADVPKLQAQIAEQQAQLDAYEQRADAAGPVAAARQALDAAQDAQAKAQAAYAANLDELTLAGRYRDGQIQYNDSTTAHDAAVHDAEAKATEANVRPILLPPDRQDTVQLVTGPDQRVWYLAGAIGLILLLFAGPIWIALREPPADLLPYAALAPPRDEQAHDAHHEDFRVMDDEHPALT